MYITLRNISTAPCVLLCCAHRLNPWVFDKFFLLCLVLRIWCLNTIMRYTPQRDKQKVGKHLKGFETLRVLVGELLHPSRWGSSVTAADGAQLPFLLLWRRRDNFYLLSFRVPDHLHAYVRFGLAHLLGCMYGIPLK